MGELYEVDVLEWSEHQARLLRQHAAGEPGSKAPDWPNIVDEIESLGHEQRLAWQSLTVQALLHDLRCEAWPLLPHVPYWRAEARMLRDQARERWTRSMRQRVDLDRLYRQALRAMPDTVDGQPPLPVPAMCPVTLDDLVAGEP